jgi:hypothetical protein
MLSGTPYVYGHPIAPCAMADAKGNVSIVMVSCVELYFLLNMITDKPI